MAQKPAIPKGTRDFLPAEVAKRNYMFATIKDLEEGSEVPIDYYLS